MNGLFPISQKMISADELRQRWPAVRGHDEDIARLIDMGCDRRKRDAPKAYKCDRVLTRHDKTKVYYCRRGYLTDSGESDLYSWEFFYGEQCYNFKDIFFILSEIEGYEKDHLYLFYEPAEHRCCEQESTAPLHTGLNTLSYSEIIEKLKITPIELLDILNGVREWVDFQGEIEKRLVTTDEIEFRAYKESTGGKYFNANNLHSVKVYQRDFDLFCEKWAYAPEAENPVPIEAQAAQALQTENAELEAKIKYLEAQLEQAKQAYPEAPEAPEAQAYAPKRGADGRAAKAEKFYAKVASVFPAMSEAYQEILRSEPRPFSRAEIAEKAKEKGSILDDAQITVIARALPEPYKPKPGAKKTTDSKAIQRLKNK